MAHPPGGFAKLDVRVAYMNGMVTRESGAREVALILRDIVSDLRQAPAHNHLHPEVQVQYNDAFTPVDALKTGGLGLGGLGLFRYGERLASLVYPAAGGVLRFIGATMMIGAIGKIGGVHAHRHTRAERLADELRAFLEPSPHRRLTLVVHSQGAMIVRDALVHLCTTRQGALTERIHCLVIGGATSIAGGDAHVVSHARNFVFENDVVAISAQFLPQWTGFHCLADAEGVHVVQGGFHGASAYVRLPEFRTALIESSQIHRDQWNAAH